VRSETKSSNPYVGYEIDPAAVTSWLSKAADLGSPSAQAIHWKVQEVLKTYLNHRNGNAIGQRVLKSSLPDPSINISWLIRATSLGSHIASQCLRSLYDKSWQEADLQLRTEFCGVGQRLFNQQLTSMRNTSLESSSAELLHIFGRLELSGDTALHFAAVMGRLDLVEYLSQNPRQA